MSRVARNHRSKGARAFRTLSMRRRCIGKGHLLHDTQLRVGRSIQMLDLIMLAMGLGFFVVSVGYAYACDRL
jgi:hypothetical protein